MRTGRAIIISATLMLGMAGSILASPAVSTATAHAPAVHAQATAPVVGRNIYYHA